MFQLFLISVFYFVIRMVDLLKLPIFNDEAIYINWGWQELHTGNFFLSLFDAKPPLLMWVFGWAEGLFSDPLFAGRTVSVFFGFLSLLGIYFIAKKIYGKKIAIISTILYILVPIFSFYDRQALMESAVTSVGIWSFYFFLQFQGKNKRKLNTVFLGLIIGLGYFIKTDAVIFLISGLVLGNYYLFFSKSKISRFVEYNLILLSSFILVISLLLSQKSYWLTLSTNSRYILTLGEILRFPIMIWLKNVWVMSEVLSFYITLPVSLLAIYGLGKEIQRKKFYMPEKKSFVGIYRLKSNCKDNYLLIR